MEQPSSRFPGSRKRIPEQAEREEFFKKELEGAADPSFGLQRE